MRNISRHCSRIGGVLIFTILLTGCATAWHDAAGDVDNTLYLEPLVSSREIRVVAFDYSPYTGQVYFIGFPRRHDSDARGIVPSYATAVLYRLDLSTGRRVDVYRNFEVGPKNPFVAALQDGGVMVLRGHDEYRVLREDPDYSLLTFHNDTLSHRLEVIRGSELAEGKSSDPMEKRTKDPENDLTIERNCRTLARQSSTITPIGQVVYRLGDEYEIIPRFIAITRQHSEQQVALDVLRCGGYDFYAEFAHRITEQSETLWNPDARGDVKLFKSTPYSETWRSDEFQIPGRQFRIRHVSPASLTLVRLYHNFNCEQYVNQIFYRGKTYQTKTCIRMIHKLPTSHYLFAGDDFLLLFKDGIMKGSIP